MSEFRDAEPAREGPELSIIAPMYNEAQNVRLLAARVERAMAAAGCDYELVFVDDGSRDGSCGEVLTLMRESAGQRIRLVPLVRNFGKEAAILAGYDHARGRSVIVVDADLQQPPELFAAMLELWRSGYDIVQAVRADTVGISRVRRGLSHAFYAFNAWLAGTDIPSNSADFGLIDRAVVDIVRSCREHHRFNRALVAWSGFRRTTMVYTAEARHAGRSHWSWPKLCAYALDGILSFSIKPLRLVGLTGGLLSGLGVGYMLVVSALRIVRPDLASPSTGYTSLVGLITLLGGFHLMAIWLLGEYVGRIYEQVKGRPSYIVRPMRVRGAEGGHAAISGPHHRPERADAPAWRTTGSNRESQS